MITPFYSQNEDLLVGADKSALKDDGVKTAGTIEVYSISKFAINLILCIGEMGDEGSEIVATHVTTAPSGTTVYLHSALIKDHPKDTPVYIIPYNQVEFSHSTTTTGAKTVLSTQTIDPEKTGNRWDEATYSTGYVFTRFLNSVTGAYSNYSDPYPFAGQEMNTVGYLIEDASDGLDEEGKVKFETKIRIINKALRYVRGKLKHWNDFLTTDYVLDQTVDGTFEYDMPSDIYDPNSNKSILSVRIEDNDVLDYMDKRELNEKKENDTVTEGNPSYYTVYDGKIALWPTPDDNYDNLDIIMDYYTDVVEVDSEADTITMGRYDMFYYYLRWEIRNIIERNGKKDYTDGDWMMFKEILADAIRKDVSGQKWKWKVKVSRIADSRGNRLSFDKS